jgi:hypothetical protein
VTYAPRLWLVEPDPLHAPGMVRGPDPSEPARARVRWDGSQSALTPYRSPRNAKIARTITTRPTR